MTEKTSELDEVKQTLLQNETQLKSITDEKTKAAEELEKTAGSLDDLKEQYGQFDQNLKELRIAKEALQEELAKADKKAKIELQKMDAYSKALSASSSDTLNELETVKDDLAKSQESKEKLVVELQALAKEKVEAQNKYEAENSQLEASIKDLESKMADIEAELEGYR